MTAPSQPSRGLPLLPVHGNRSAMTCLYRCGNACSHPAPNTSDNEYFGDVVATEVSRRGVMRAGALGALVVGAGAAGVTVGAGAAVAAPEAVATGHGNPRPGTGPLTFKPIPPNTLDTVVVPNGYDHAVLLAWGDPILPGAPEFNVDRQTAKAQAGQFGYNNDWLVSLPLDRKGDRLLLVVNHEYTNEELMFRAFTNMDALNVESSRWPWPRTGSAWSRSNGSATPASGRR